MKDILKVDPEVVIFTLQCAAFRKAFLENPYILLNPNRAIGFLRDIALYYHVSYSNELDWVLNIDTNTEFESTFTYLSDLIVNTLLARQQMDITTDTIHACILNF